MSLSKDCLSKTIGPSDIYDFLAVYPHSSASGHNLHVNKDNELNDGDAIYNASVLFKSFPFKTSYPVPVYPPARIKRPVVNGLDPCLDLINRKKNWESSKDILLDACNQSMVQDFSSEDELEEVTRVKIHPNVYKLSEHLKSDPDQHFNASYNWYFSGSNIELVNFGDRKYLARPNISSGELLFSPLVLQNNQWKPENSECNELKFNMKSSFVHQVDVVKNFVLIREKSNCSYVMVKEKDDSMFVVPLNDISTSGDNPIICAGINKENSNEFCVLSSNEELTIWNASTSSAVSKLNLNLRESYSADSWGYFYYIDLHTLLYINRQTVNLIDLRIRDPCETMKWPVNKLVDICEEISCCNSGNGNINYIGTNHHLLSLDIRQGWTQRWTHGITSSPSILKVMQRNFQDYIFLGSQRSDSVVFIQNDFEVSSSGISRFHPYTMPSLRESLHIARYNGLCLDHLPTSRFTMALTGLCCLEDRYINVIRCTSIGDIFWQKLESSDGAVGSSVRTDLSPDDIKKFEEFEFKCEESYLNTDNTCHVTSIQSTQKLIDYLFTSSCPTDDSKNSTHYNNLKLAHCKQLKDYCDYLAPVILEPWNIDTLTDDGSNDKSQEASSDYKNFSGGSSNSEEEYNIEDAVSSWLDTYANDMTTNLEYKLDDDEPDNIEPSEMINEEDKIKKNNNEELIKNSKLDITLPELSTDKNIAEKISKNIKKLPLPTPKKKFISGF